MLHIITAPEPLPKACTQTMLFLAGSIDQGAAVDWQTQLIESLAKLPITVCNPRRTDWDPSWREDDPRLAEQIAWEQQALHMAHMVVFVFDPQGQAPVSLLELGLCLSRGIPCIVFCPEGYWRRANVLQTAKRFDAHLVDDFADIVPAIQNLIANGGSDRTVYEGRFLRLQQRGRWEFAQRTNARDVVALIALTSANELILIEQTRIPIGTDGRRVIELPAGLVGDDGDAHEPATEAARRELEEETGYTSTQLQVVTRGPSSAGLCDECITLILAHDCRKIAAGGGVDGENIHTHVIPLPEVPAWLAAQTALIDPKVWAGLWFAQQQL